MSGRCCVPLGEYAVRTNLLSAIFSAAGAGLLLSRGPRVARAGTRRTGRSLGSAAAAALAAMIGGLHLHQLAELERDRGLRGRDVHHRGGVLARAAYGAAAGARSAPGDRLLLLIVYLAGARIGNHLLALLAGPAVVVFLAVHAPAAPRARAVAPAARVGPSGGRSRGLGAADRHRTGEHRTHGSRRGLLRGRGGLRHDRAGPAHSPGRAPASRRSG